MAQFYVQPEYEGKSLRDIASQRGGYFPRLDILGGFGGVGENAPLKAGMSFNLPNDPGSGEYQWASQVFTGSPVASAATSPTTNVDQARQAVEPAIQTLKSGIDPLKQKYNDLIASIKGKGAVAEQEAGIASAREFGKRGIPLSSGAYDQYLSGQVNPVRQQYAGLEAETGLGAQNAEQSILSAIASLQGQAGFTGLEQALAYAQLAQQQKQFESTQALSREQFREPQQQQQSPYTTLSEGQTLLNLLTGQPLYTAPKTYKSVQSQFGGGDSLGLFG